MWFWTMRFQWTHWLRVNAKSKQQNIVPFSEKPIWMWMDPEFQRAKMVVAVLRQQRSTVVGIPTGSGRMNNPTNTAHLLLWVLYVFSLLYFWCLSAPLTRVLMDYRILYRSIKQFSLRRYSLRLINTNWWHIFFCRGISKRALKALTND